MQTRSWPFWLMIVSTQMADLPVWRSPMINSRCPRPIGIMASIGLMPVCTGRLTLLRSMTPGAMRSMLRNFVVTIGPLPSSGWPSGSTTRPSRASPTGTEAMRCVRRTNWPSSMSAYSPRMITPTRSSSRLNAMPSAPLANSTSSFDCTLVRPLTRAMPSPTSSTSPTSTASTCGLNALICEVKSLINDSISAAIQPPHKVGVLKSVGHVVVGTQYTRTRTASQYDPMTNHGATGYVHAHQDDRGTHDNDPQYVWV